MPDFVEYDTTRQTITIEAEPARVWTVLVDPAYTRQWGNEFSEGTWVETDWTMGSTVLWKDGEGNVGAKGVVIANELNRFLKVAFYDDVTAEPPVQTGVYAETYTLVRRNGHTELSIEAGPLEKKYVSEHTLLWKNALAKMKSLAEHTSV